ncbi:MAG: hypothetical protein ACREP1_11905, partial [Rhodanobacteraceae bacterium]
MHVRYRALLAALVIVVAAFAGALYLAYRTGADVAAGRLEGANTFASIDLQHLLSPQMVDEHLVTLAYRQV